MPFICGANKSHCQIDAGCEFSNARRRESFGLDFSRDRARSTEDFARNNRHTFPPCPFNNGLKLDFARQQLGTRGEFFPFAVAVGGNGAIEIIDARLDTADEHPPSAEVLAVCVASLRSKRAGIRACATAADVTLDQPRRGDAIRVDLEHAEGHALTVDLPYTKQRRRGIHYGPIQAHAGPHQIWEPPDR